MKIAGKIFGLIFGVFACVLGSLSLLVVTPIYLIIFAIGGEKADKTAHKLSRIWASYVLLCYGVRLKVHDKNLIKPHETYVFISNHRSHIDIPVCARATTNTFKFLAKDELVKIPLLGYIIKKLYITVRRQSIRDKVLAIKKMEAELEKGISIWLYPEGTRNTTEEPMTDFQDGAFTVAVNTGKPLAVLTIYDTAKILKPGGIWNARAGTVNAWWAEPIETKGLTRKDIPALKEKVREVMLKKIGN
jgi:1-acyl-sn-glycerol-3-phosphate acyltransferase